MLPDYPDLLDALRSGLPDLLNGQQVMIGSSLVTLSGITAGTSLPADVEGVAGPGFVRLGALNDPDDGITRYMDVTTEVFSTRYDRGRAIGERIRGILLSETRIGGVTIDRRTTSGPREVPWDDNNRVRRFIATHRITTRR